MSIAFFFNTKMFAALPVKESRSSPVTKGFRLEWLWFALNYEKDR